MRQFILLILVLTVVACAPAELLGQRRIVEIEVATSARAPIETQQRWMQMLTDVGADRVRSRTANSSATIKVSESESASAVRVKVQGAIENGKLILPGKSFSIRDKDALRDYIQQLKVDGADVALADKKAFGLTSQQLVDINSQLKKTLNLETQGKSANDVIRFAKRNLSVDLVLDKVARRAVANDEPVLDEFNGMSMGTALAAIVRPLGLVLVPRREQGGDVELNIVDFRSADEHWPIGWPLSDFPKNAAPSLFAKFPIEVRDFPLDQALKAVCSRTKVAMVFDYNSMARADIDLSQTLVTFVEKKSSYIHSLGKMLNQTKPRMSYEIRLDENGKPFLWLTTANSTK